MRPYLQLFAEVRIDSKKEYNEYSFELGENIQKFMDENPISEEYHEELFVSDIKEMIRKQINSIDKKIVIKDIIIVLK